MQYPKESTKKTDGKCEAAFFDGKVILNVEFLTSVRR
jgi:hypothetical protein